MSYFYLQFTCRQWSQGLRVGPKYLFIVNSNKEKEQEVIRDFCHCFSRPSQIDFAEIPGNRQTSLPDLRYSSVTDTIFICRGGGGGVGGGGGEWGTGAKQFRGLASS